MADKPFPIDEAGINLLLQSLAANLPTYTASLPVLAADVTFITKAAENYQYLVNVTPQVSDAKESFTKFKGVYFTGTGKPIAPATPTFPTIDVPNPDVVNIVPETKAVIKRIKAAAGYTEVIGEALGLVDSGSDAVNPVLVAALKLKALSGSRVEISFSKQGQDAMKVEFKRKTGGWLLAGIYTTSPGIHFAAPINDGDPESLEYRGTLLKKNVEVGTTSPTYTVVTTP